jgi:ABC-type Fe3+/spermidine/putrescine transport system ATPase subunit
LIQNDSPKETYENPYNDYVAKLLGEVNIFSEGRKINLIFPKTLFSASDKNCRKWSRSCFRKPFAGSHYRNKA